MGWIPEASGLSSASPRSRLSARARGSPARVAEPFICLCRSSLFMLHFLLTELLTDIFFLCSCACVRLVLLCSLSGNLYTSFGIQICGVLFNPPKPKTKKERKKETNKNPTQNIHSYFSHFQTVVVEAVRGDDAPSICHVPPTDRLIAFINRPKEKSCELINGSCSSQGWNLHQFYHLVQTKF